MYQNFVPFLKLNNILLYFVPHFVHSSVDWYLDYCHLLATECNTTMNICVQVSVQVPTLNSFECTSISRSNM